MPGHATAAIAAYPELGAAMPTAGAPLPVSASWGVHTHLFNLEPQLSLSRGRARRSDASSSPSRSFTSAAMKRSRTSGMPRPRCRRAPGSLGLNDPDALQAYFTQRIGRYLAAHGAADHRLGRDSAARTAAGRHRHVVARRLRSAQRRQLAGNDTVLAPRSDAVLRPPAKHAADRTAGPPERHFARGRVPLRAARCDARRRTTAARARRPGRICGPSTCKPKSASQWMALPRAAALAEVGWSAAPRRRWPDFLDRLVPMFARYRAFGLELCGQRVRAGRGDFTQRRRASRVTPVESGAERRRRSSAHSLHARRPRTLRRIDRAMTRP